MFRRVEVSKTTGRFRLLVFVIVIVIFVLPANFWLRAMAHSLVREDPLQPADLVVVEMAVLPSPEALARAADIVRLGYAKRIAVTRYLRSERLADGGVELPKSLDKLLDIYLADAGLDPSTIEYIPIKVIDPVTLNSARQVAEYCHAQHVSSVIIVPARYHSRRSTLSYAAYMTPLGIELRSRPAQSGLTPDNWWKTKDGFLTVTHEYIKLLYYRAFVLPWARA